MFIDPRNDPRPCDPRPAPRTTGTPEELADFHRLCRAALIYEVEKWIREGRPLQAVRPVTQRGRRVSSALEIALENGDQSLALLLLCNGYDPNLERSCPVSFAIRNRQWAFVELLLAWGADPLRVSPRDLCESYNTELIERFHNLGIDFCADHVLGTMLAEHSSNKPLFGFAKRHREHHPRIQVELNIALGHHAGRDGTEKGVLLCLWAGANPHARAPSLRHPETDDEAGEHGSTAVEEACSAGDVRILQKLRPDPSLDDFDELYRWAPNSAIVDFLANFTLPKKESVGGIVRSQLFWLRHERFIRSRSTDALRHLFSAGIRWETATSDDIKDVRRALLDVSDYTFVDVMKLLAIGDNCAPAILESLGRTPAMRVRMKAVGFFPPSAEDPWRDVRPRPTRSREVLAKFGVELPKAERVLPRTVEAGPRYRAGAEVRLDRTSLFEQVWTEPVEKLAKQWNLSGRGLAKVCARARIPVPPRGYWAKVQRGMRVGRPALPKLGPGEITEVVIHVPTRAVTTDPDERGGTS